MIHVPANKVSKSNGGSIRNDLVLGKQVHRCLSLSLFKSHNEIVGWHLNNARLIEPLCDCQINNR